MKKKVLIIRSACEDILRRCVTNFVNQNYLIDVLSDRTVENLNVNNFGRITIEQDSVKVNDIFNINEDYNIIIILIDLKRYNIKSYNKFITFSKLYKSNSIKFYDSYDNLFDLRFSFLVFLPHLLNDIVNKLKRKISGGIKKTISYFYSSNNLKISVLYYLIYFLKPFKKIKFIELYTSRIGHFAFNTEVFLRYAYLKKDKAYYIGIISQNVSNNAFLKLMKRKMPVISINAGKVIKKSKLKEFYVGTVYDYSCFWNYRGWQNSPRNLYFSKKEEKLGKTLLNEMGIDSWFVCFHTRDSTYLKYLNPEIDCKYHDFRDCNIDNYLPAMEYITSLGGYAIRMGQIVEKPLISNKNKKIIDYATNYRTEFMDIYLSAKCKFFVGTSSGIIVLPVVFDVPYIICNLIPLEQFPAFKESDICIPKLIKSKRENRLLKFKEIIDSGIGRFLKTNEYENFNLECIENSDDEILDSVIEMNSRVNNTYNKNSDIEKLKSRFASLFNENHYGYDFYDRIGGAFIKKYEDLL